MLKKTHLYFYILGIFLLLDGFILYGYPQRYFEFFFCAVIVFLCLSDKTYGLSITKDKYVFVSFLMLFFISFTQVFVGKYGGTYSLTSTLLLLGNYCFFYSGILNKNINKNRNKKIFSFDTFIYLGMFLSLLIQFIVRMREDPAVVNSIYDIYYSLGRDKNILGIIVYCFFCTSFKRKNYLGIILTILFAITLNSRMLILMLMLFMIVYFFNKPISNIWFKIVKKRYFLVFICTLIITIVISALFVSYVSSHGLVSYQSGWNDGSNYMRCTSNLYCLKKMRSNPYFIFWGVDKGVYDYLGITSDVRFMGERVVQPHNDILNQILRCGLLYSIIYWWLMAKLLRKSVTVENLQYFIPFLFASMFIRPIFAEGISLFVVYVLFLNVEEHEINHKKLHFRKNKEIKRALDKYLDKEGSQ